MNIVGLFAIGIFLLFVAWYVFGLIQNTFLRILLRSLAVGICATPSILVGHGIFIVPAFMVIFAKGHFWTGLLPIIVVSLISLALTANIKSLRTATSPAFRELDKFFAGGAYIKVPLLGLLNGLLIRGFAAGITEHAAVYIGILFIQILLAYVICYASAKHNQQYFWQWPILYVILLGIPSIGSVLFLIFGFAGSFRGVQRVKESLWILLAATALFLSYGIMQLIFAIRAESQPHVRVTGGIYGQTFVVSICCLFILYIIFRLWKNRSAVSAQ